MNTTHDAVSAWPLDAVSRCRALGSSTLYEASGLDCAVDPGIHAIWNGAWLAGPAFPVACSPGDNLSLHIALERAPGGSVLVVSTGGFLAGYWGEVLSVAAQVAGIKGLVIDGGVRDVDALERLGFPVFARGISMRGTIKKSAPSVAKPIQFGGVSVASGDFVFGDRDGVLILPESDVVRTLSAADARAKKEVRMMKKLREGSTTMALMGLDSL